MNIRLFIASIVVTLTALASAHASINLGFGTIPTGGHLTIQSYGQGVSPFYGQTVTSFNYREPGYSTGYFRDTTSGISFGGVSSRNFNVGYSNYVSPNGQGVGTVTWRASGTSGTYSQYRTVDPSGTAHTYYVGSGSYGSGVTDNYAYRQPTIWGNGYGRPVSHGYDMLGSSGY